MHDLHGNKTPLRRGSDLIHDGVLGIFGFNDGRLYKVTLPVVTVPAGNDGQVWGVLGVAEPPADPSKRLEEDYKVRETLTRTEEEDGLSSDEMLTLSSMTAEKKVLKSSTG